MYYINQKNHHEKVDGDNDTWLYLVDARTYHEGVFEPVVKRQGDSLKDGNLSWLDWGVRAFELKKGINHIYIGGRSNGWGIDQIAVYSDSVPAEKLNAIGIKTSEN
uniref:hypothetical protein n=1 Tax=Flexithrix dorotheae TaxID=70993 RepID=UPI00036EC028|nr:hypothetical protein [Flexithrix dorotheae]